MTALRSTRPAVPLVVAHRGASHAHPPGNTLEAFAAARALGADWVELDVRRTADGALAVHHDPHLPDGRALIDVAAADLPDEVPLLAAALEACAGMGVNVEIKNDHREPDWDAAYTVVEPVLAAMHAAEANGWLITSFDPGTVARVRALDAPFDSGLLAFDLSDAASVVAAAVDGGHRTLNPWDPFVTPELVELAHGAGLEVHVWTVDDPDRMAELAEWGVEGIITNVPDVLRAVVGPQSA